MNVAPAICSIDFETRSRIDLRQTGTHIYAAHPSTAVWCASYRIGDGPLRRWALGGPFPADLRAHVDGGGVFRAWNASFERVIWRDVLAARHGWPALPDDAWYCTMADARAMALPGSLEAAALAVGIAAQKDMQGNALMLRMCRPRRIHTLDTHEGDWRSFTIEAAADPIRYTLDDGAVLEWWADDERRGRLAAYCDGDVEVECQLRPKIRRLDPDERAVWLLTERINDLGLYIDAEACHAAMGLAADAVDRMNRELRVVTGGAVAKCSEVGRLVEWLASRGVPTESVDKAAIEELLQLDDELPADCRRALELRREAGKSSTTKLKAFLQRRGAGGRLRGALSYHIASTGRWGAQGAQLHNLARGTLGENGEAALALDDIVDWWALTRGMLGENGEAVQALDDIVDWRAVDAIEMLWGPVMSTVSSCVRPCISAAPGNTLICADYSNIEGRGLAWEAGERWKLAAFRAFDAGEGADLYKLAAGRIYHVDVGAVTKQQRQIGKVSELACGYGGGVGAFQSMAKVYGVKVPDAEADEIKGAWRLANPAIVELWGELERAAKAALSRPGRRFEAGPFSFRVSGSFLSCRLPSGRQLFYPFPAIKPMPTPWGEVRDTLTYMGVDSKQGSKTYGKWTRLKTYGGKLAENVTQAVARDLLADAKLRLAAEGVTPILSVHDELLAEVPDADGEARLRTLIEIMTATPAWAHGMPVAAEGWHGKRYRK